MISEFYLEASDWERFDKGARAVLERLMRGPVTSVELHEITGHGYRQRISDIRAEIRPRGWNIPRPERIGDGGTTLYRLVRNKHAKAEPVKPEPPRGQSELFSPRALNNW